MDTLTITGRDAVLIAKALKPATSKDVTKPHLRHVYIFAGNPGTVKMACTDGYRLHLLTIDNQTGWGTRLFVNTEELVKAFISLGRDAKDSPVVLSSVDATVTAGGSTITLSTCETYFPELETLFGQVRETELPAVFNGDYLSDMAKAAQLIGGETGIKVLSINPTKPAHIQSSSGTITFDGLLMPQRSA
jgi:hypothetical protein